MANTDLAVRIATILDSTGLNKADKGIKKLEKQAKSLGKTLGIALSTTAVVAFGKASVKAFAEDELAAARLSKAVDNLGLSFANPQIASFIDTLSETSGVVDDQLRPAMQALLTTTGSLAKSQELLNLAVETSRGSSVELATVSQDLANAYVGNTKGLKKYNLGLTQAELKAASFATIQEKLNQQFSGSSAAYLATYTGRMQLLTTAAGEAKEAIGSGLIDSFKILTADSGITDLTTKIKNLGTYIGDFFRGLAQGFKDLAQYPVIKQLLQLTGLMLKVIGKAAGAFIDPFIKAGAQSRSSALAPSSANSHLAGLTAESNAKAAAKAEAAAKKRAADLLKAQKQNTTELKKQALTKKQSALFDLEQIGIIAALKGNISKEERLRLELQLALITGNETQAAKLSKQLADSIDSTGKLSAYLTTLPDAKNPFKAWDEWLKTFKTNLAAVTGGTLTDPITPKTNVAEIPATNVAVVPSFDPTKYAGSNQTGFQSPAPIVVSIDGKAVATAVQNQNNSGNFTGFSRLGDFKTL